MRKVLDVHLGGAHCYNIILSDTYALLCDDLKEWVGDDHSKKVCIVSDTNVASIYLDKIRSLIEIQYPQVFSFVFEAGEQSKNLDVVQQLYEHLTINHFDRHDFLIALGGGVVGDLTGFAAATYLRGIDFVQLPTSLLAQIDSSIGGKTGVDFLQYKNMVGAFYQPKLVYMSMEVFETLPRRQFANGMAEELKHGLIKDRDYYLWMRDHKGAIMGKDPQTMLHMLETGCQIKKTVVEHDPTEKGERALLNFGHTIGHAIEKMSDFSLLHGECVSIGMVAAAYLSKKHGYLSDQEFTELLQVLKDYELPVSISGFSGADILATTKSDKKRIGSQIKFILLHAMGDACIDLSLSDEELLEAINFIME